MVATPTRGSTTPGGRHSSCLLHPGATALCDDNPAHAILYFPGRASLDSSRLALYGDSPRPASFHLLPKPLFLDTACSEVLLVMLTTPRFYSSSAPT